MGAKRKMKHPSHTPTQGFKLGGGLSSTANHGDTRDRSWEMCIQDKIYLLIQVFHQHTEIQYFQVHKHTPSGYREWDWDDHPSGPCMSEYGNHQAYWLYYTPKTLSAVAKQYLSIPATSTPLISGEIVYSWWDMFRHDRFYNIINIMVNRDDMTRVHTMEYSEI